MKDPEKQQSVTVVHGSMTDLFYGSNSLKYIELNEFFAEFHTVLNNLVKGTVAPD